MGEPTQSLIPGRIAPRMSDYNPLVVQLKQTGATNVDEY